MSEAVLNFQTIGRSSKGHARASGYERAAHDWYCEPPRAVDALLDAEQFIGEVLDPACGGGNIVQRCLARGIEAHGSDLVDRANGAFPILDFFDIAEPVDNIISNPPYNVAEQFVLHALRLATRKVAVLVRSAFTEGQGRLARLYTPHPPVQIWQFASRISMPPGGTAIEAKGGSVAFCWVVWDTRSRGGRTEYGWLP
jgi:hypothetical protein